MTDRELLESAARAAGISGFWVDAGINTRTDACPDIWNPLKDDGDALRLAVKLNMNFTLSGKHAAVAQAGSQMAQEFCNGDPGAAARRAITRAAAAIAEKAPKGAFFMEKQNASS